MKMKLVNRGNEAEVILEGRLDANSSPEAESILLEQAKRFEVLVLNFESLEYISSAGLRVLKILDVTMKNKGGELVLTNVNRMIMEVFEMTGFAGRLKFR